MLGDLPTWLKIVLAFGVPTVVVLVGRLGIRGGLDAIERSRLRRKGGSAPSLEPIPGRWVAPVALVAQCGLSLVLLVRPHLFDKDVQAFAILVALGLIFSAVAVNRFPDHDRRLKYELLVGGIFATTAITAAGAGDTWYGRIAYIDHALAPLWLGVGSLVVHRLTRSTAESWRRARAIYRGVMIAGPGAIHGVATFFVVRLTMFTSCLYLALRYHAKERMKERPVLYLRSFAAPAGDLFARVLAPAVLTRYMIVGLVHEDQLAADVQRKVEPGWHGTLVSVGADRWRSWVETQLARCQAVVLDARVRTPGITWEIDTVLARLPAERIAILVDAGAPRLAGATTITYGGPQHTRFARAALADWIDRLP